uniref:[histone H3]-trimethyl-L-lysine(9) demethylase n=1 Tax=Strigamia maritima TaxID=126957 RepID=T1ITK4_STRMM
MTTSALTNVPKIMVFRPTYDEFKDFNKYMQHVESVGAHKAGLAKIIPPKEWVPHRGGYDDIDMIIPAPIKQIVNGRQGLFQQYNMQQKAVTVKEFKKLADSTTYCTPAHCDYDELERKYWKNITYAAPMYGADVSGSLYDDDVDEWNINRLNTILDCVNSDYGIKIEAPKSWYAIPPEHGRRLERLASGFFPTNFGLCPAFLRHKMTLISPQTLKQYSIPYNKITQEAGEFMVTFPYGYHAGFNHGFNCAESTNFATPRWVEYGKRAVQCTCRKDSVKIDMETFVKRFQPDRYELWKIGRDVGPHPEDPTRITAAPPPYKSAIFLKKGRKKSEDSVTISKRHPLADIDTKECANDEEMTENPLDDHDYVGIDDNLLSGKKKKKSKHSEDGDGTVKRKKTTKKQKKELEEECLNNEASVVLDKNIVKHTNRSLQETFRGFAGNGNTNGNDLSVLQCSNVKSTIPETIQRLTVHLKTAKASTSTATEATMPRIPKVAPTSPFPILKQHFLSQQKSQTQTPQRSQTDMQSFMQANQQRCVRGPVRSDHQRPMMSPKLQILHPNSLALVNSASVAPVLRASFPQMHSPRQTVVQNVVQPNVLAMQHKLQERLMANKHLLPEQNNNSSLQMYSGQRIKQEIPDQEYSVPQPMFKNGNGQHAFTYSSCSIPHQTFPPTLEDHRSYGSRLNTDSMTPPDLGPPQVGRQYTDISHTSSSICNVKQEDGSCKWVSQPGFDAHYNTEEQQISPVLKVFNYNTASPSDSEAQKLRNEVRPKQRKLSLNKHLESSDEEMNSSMNGDEEWAKPVAELWQFKTPCFEAEKKFNSHIAGTAPHCSICLLFQVPNFKNVDFSINGPKIDNATRFPDSHVKMPDGCFNISAGNNTVSGATSIMDSEGYSPLLVCSICRVTVHASCYGVTMFPGDRSSWKCTRCSEQFVEADCCLCNLRGGALKRTTDGRWAHVMCAIVISDVTFDNIVTKEPIDVSKVSSARKKLNCIYCQNLTKKNMSTNTSMSACVQCSAGRCPLAFHVTCAYVARTPFTTDNWPDLIQIPCIKHTLNKKEKNNPTSSTLSSHLMDLSVNQEVIAKHRNKRYYPAVITHSETQEYYSVDFEDNSHSDDLLPQDIESHNCLIDGPPQVGETVRVRWKDNLLYHAIFRGRSAENLYTVEFEDGSECVMKRESIFSKHEELPTRSTATEMRHVDVFTDTNLVDGRRRTIKINYAPSNV